MNDEIRELAMMIAKMESGKADFLYKLLESGTDGYWDWHINSGKDGEEDYEYLSPKFKKQFGYEVDEMEHKPSEWQKICDPEDLKTAYGKITEALETNGEFMSECKYTHKEGHIINILCRGRTIEWNEDGSPKRMVGTHTDITELRK